LGAGWEDLARLGRAWVPGGEVGLRRLRMPFAEQPPTQSFASPTASPTFCTPSTTAPPAPPMAARQAGEA
jgi:hypothetical protein